jgi:hypothetical protein
MNEQSYIYDPENQTMVFSADEKRNVRVAFGDDQVWYVFQDIAQLFRYRAPYKVAKNRNYEVKQFVVPSANPNVRCPRNCNCVTKDAVKQFLKTQHTDKEICRWILNVVIPQAERQFETYQNIRDVGQDVRAVKQEPSAQTPGNVTTILAVLDKIITEAVLLKHELQ